MLGGLSALPADESFAFGVGTLICFIQARGGRVQPRNSLSCYVMPNLPDKTIKYSGNVWPREQAERVCMRTRTMFHGSAQVPPFMVQLLRC